MHRIVNLGQIAVGVALAMSTCAAAAGRVDALTGVGLSVSDIARSEVFYERALGFQEARRIPNGADDPKVVALSTTGRMDAPLIVLRRSDTPLLAGHEGFGRIILATKDGVAVAAQIQHAGYEVTRTVEAPDGPGSLEVWTKDPDGYQVEVFQAASTQ